MAWVNTSRKSLIVKTESTITLPASATFGYTSVIDDLLPDPTNNNRFVSILVVASAISGTNIDVGLFGSMTPTGSKFLLLDAVVADVTNSAKSKGGVVDLNAYPAPYYWIGWEADTNESANTVTVTIFDAAGKR